uniref:Lipase maturation factor n=1 Tax=Plectus sambesii TaxID=2011161 RepID=A0A914W755_9BILA
GMIKVRGDQCWRDLTCMDYHYETQPVPSPNSYFMHHSPAAVHKLEVLSNHFAELLAPALVLVPLRMARIIGGIVQIVFMTGITISGNLSFLNHLTMLPTICCFDDRFLSFLFSKATKDKIALLQLQASSIKRPVGFYIRKVMDISLFALLAYLSIPVVQNLCSRRQVMNTSFDPLRIVNTYGAFGSITRERTEVVMQGTTAHDPYDSSAQWLEYEFKCKPGNVTRRPCYISPYHYRLDWLMWFAAFQNYQHNPWLVHLVAKMLNNDAFISELLEHNPFLDKDPPR